MLAIFVIVNKCHENFKSLVSFSILHYLVYVSQSPFVPTEGVFLKG